MSNGCLYYGRGIRPVINSNGQNKIKQIFNLITLLMTNKLVPLILFLVFCVIPCFGNEAESNESDLIKRIAEACVSGIHEPAECSLLLQGSEKYGLSELANLATIRESRTLDVGNKHMIAAAQALLQYAEKAFGEGSYQAIVCRRSYITATSATDGSKAREHAKKNADLAKKLSAQNPTNDQYKILELLARLERIASTDPFDEDSPENWKEIRLVTKEALPFLRNWISDPEHIELRILIHQLNSRNTTYQDYVNVYLLDSIFQDQTIGDVFIDFDNYLTPAIESCKEFYGDNDVRVLTTELVLLETQMASQTKDYESLHSRMKEIQDILTNYCPQNDISPVNVELLKWDCDIAYGQNMYELMSPLPLLQKVADFYGEDSEMYLVYLSRIMYQQLVVDPDRAASLCNDIRTLAEKIYSSDSDEYGYFMLNMFHAIQSLSEQNPELLQDYVTDICNYYRNHHHSTWLSISTGRNLAIYLHNLLLNSNLAYEMYNISFNDLSRITSKKSALYAYGYYDLAYAQLNATDPAINSLAENSFKECLKLFDNCQMSSEHIYFYLAELLFSHNKYDEAIKTLRQGIARCNPSEGNPWRCHMQLCLGSYGLFYPNVSLSQSEIDNLFNEGISTFLKQENHDGIFLQGFKIIGDYYLMKRRYNDAEKYYQQGIEYAESHYGNTERMEYIDLISDLSALYLNELQEKDKAEQLIEGKIKALKNDPYFNRYDLLLDLLWSQYYLIRNKSDIMLVTATLQSIQQEALSIIQRGGNDEQLSMNLLKPFIYEYGEFFNSFGRIMRMADEVSTTDEAINQEAEYYRQSFHQIRDSMKAQFPPTFNYVEEHLQKNNSDYINDSETCRLYNAIYRYYLAIENDTTRGEFYLQKLIQSDNFINRYRGLHELAALRLVQHRNEDAIQLLLQVKSIADQQPIAMSSPEDKALFNSELASAYYNSGQYEKAIAPAQDYFHYKQLIIQQNFDLLTQSEREQFVNEQGGSGSEFLLALLPHFPKRLSSVSYDAQLAQKGLLLRASERIKVFMQHSQDPRLVEQMDSLSCLNTILKSMTIEAEVKHKDFSEYQPEYMKLRQQIEALERVINRQAMEAMGASSTPDWKQLQQVLHKGEAAIEFIVTDSIGALVLLPQGEPLYIPLSQSDHLWQDLQDIKGQSAIRKAKALYEDDRFHLYERIWQPIDDVLKDVDVVYFSPTGFLNDLVFSAIKLNSQQYLSERYELHQMLSTGDLIDLRKNAPATKPQNATIIGGIYYSPSQEQLAQSTPAAIEDERGAIVEDEETFGYLPFTLNEVKTLSRIFSNNGLNTKLGSGFEPTEESLIALNNNSPHVLHLSTHGFFVAQEDVESNKFLSRFPMSMISSMQRCGLALVDANRTWEGATDQPENNDGIITANEVALLDLSSTRLAVLSACQTAVGEYNGEGVFGMHRGFKQAGVKSILATMWNVNDKSTARFMELFYERWLTGNPMQQSFNEAVNELRKEYPSPYYWAPFVLMDAEN